MSILMLRMLPRACAREVKVLALPGKARDRRLSRPLRIRNVPGGRKPFERKRRTFREKEIPTSGSDLNSIEYSKVV